tara:strand:+ start:504 stop:677 length:174 start_codon:yes stop_codon:yes gene_type:complete
MKMNLRLKALLILPISPVWIIGALIIDHWDDVAGYYKDIFKAIAGKHHLQKKERAKK